MTAGTALKLAEAVETPAAAAGQEDAHVIVFGNEKGGTGKTTTAMHVVVALMRLGKTVTAIDLDGRQRTFARYIQNRAEFVARSGHKLPVPNVQVIERAKPGTADAAADEGRRFDEAVS